MKIGEESDGIYRNFFFQNEETETVNGRTIGEKEEEIINLSGVVTKDNMIGTIESWGPYFRVSFEFMIKSFVADKMTNILSFKGNGGVRQFGQPGDRDPGVYLQTKKKLLLFSQGINGNGKYSYVYKKPELNKWYKIIIEQKPINGKVRKVA